MEQQKEQKSPEVPSVIYITEFEMLRLELQELKKDIEEIKAAVLDQRK